MTRSVYVCEIFSGRVHALPGLHFFVRARENLVGMSHALPVCDLLIVWCTLLVCA